MNELSPKALKPRVKGILAGASYSPKRLALIHTFVTFCVSAIVTVLSFLLSDQINSAVGISGMAARSVLETAQTVLRLFTAVALPFWDLGMLFVGIRLVQDGNAVPRDLAEGFRRFGPALRLMLLEALLFSAIGMVSMYISSAIFMMTPYAEPFLEAAMPILSSMNSLSGELTLDEETLLAISQTLRPMLYLWAAVFALAALPLFYRLRMARFSLLSDDQCGAFAAVRESRRAMKGRRLKLLRLDLHFWWYYVLQGLTVVLCYGDVVLTKVLHISLPFSQDGMYFLFYFLYLTARLLLLWQVRAHVETAYAAFFETAGSMPIPEKKPDVTALPWSYDVKEKQ